MAHYVDNDNGIDPTYLASFFSFSLLSSTPTHLPSVSSHFSFMQQQHVDPCGSRWMPVSFEHHIHTQAGERAGQAPDLAVW